jgi:GMP synthase-like glutamine amidotransferase
MSTKNKAAQRVHWLQHAEHEELGCIGPWLQQRGHRVNRTRLYLDEPLPVAGDFDWLIVMGGPMNIYEHERYPWLIPEKALIRDACVTNIKVLGVCLGAQLLADVLGGQVTRNQYQEIGFFDVCLTGKGRSSRLLGDFPEVFPAFHWHGDTFSMPPGCQNLIKSDACVNQAFVKDNRVLGIQFHLEVTRADAARWLALEDLKPARYVHPGEEILRDPLRFEMNNALMVRLLDRLEAIG